MNVDVFSFWVFIRHMILNIHLRKKWFLCQIGNSASNQKHFYQDIQSIKIDVYTLRVFIRHIIWINSLLNAFRFKKISHLVFIMNNFKMLSQFIFSLKYSITHLTFEKFQIFCHKSYIWKKLIMNGFLMLSQFMSLFKYFITNLTFILSQILHLKSSLQEHF